MFEREYRELSFVPRWSIIRRLNEQNVAEHSYYVTLYADQFARHIKWQGDYAELMRQALIHDLDEIVTGDIVGPAKSHFVDKGKYKEYTDETMAARFSFGHRWLSPKEEIEIQSIIKIADLLDAMFYLATEAQMGNMSVQGVFKERLESFRIMAVQTMSKIFKWPNEDVDKLWSHIILPAISDHKDKLSKVVYGMAPK